MGMRFSLSNIGRLLVVIISLTHAIDIAKLAGGTEKKKAGTVIEYELTKMPSHINEDIAKPKNAMEVFMNTILTDKHGASVLKLPTGSKLGQIKEVPEP